MMAVNLRGTFFGCKRAIQQMSCQRAWATCAAASSTSARRAGSCARRARPHTARSRRRSSTSRVTLPWNTGSWSDRREHALPRTHLDRASGRRCPDTGEERAYSQSLTPFPRLGTPEDVANGTVLPQTRTKVHWCPSADLIIDGGPGRFPLIGARCRRARKLAAFPVFRSSREGYLRVTERP